MSSQPAPSAPASDANKEIEARYQWLKGMKERNDKDPRTEFHIGLTGVVDDRTKLLVAQHWHDMGFITTRRGNGHPDDPMDWLVRITARGVEAVEAEERRREAERAEAARPPIGFKP